MEDLLEQIIKEATGNKFLHLRNAAQTAHDKLQRQHGLQRDPSYELRAVCLTPMQMALETRRPKFVTLSLNGIHRIIKDERFYVGLEPENDSVWLPAQLLKTTACVSSVHSSSSFQDETMVNVLRLFLAMACSPTCTLNGRLAIEIMSRGGDCWDHGSRAVKAASLAAASQCLRTLCAFLNDEAQEVLNGTPASSKGLHHGMAQAAAVYNEVIPVMQWLCSRLVEPRQASSPAKKGDQQQSPGSLFLTECILTLTSALPKHVQTNPHFTSFLWQKFCPTLAAALGSPGRVNMDKKFTYKDAIHLVETETRGFFTGPGLDGPQARCVYLTAVQLVRIAGAQGSLRPMLEALFHRIVLLPAQTNRTEPLRCVKEIFKSPARLVDLSVILFLDKNQGLGCSDDMALFRLIIDAMEECATSALQTGNTTDASLQSSVECVVALLASLQTLCSGDIDESTMDNHTVEVIQTRYSHLKQVDYTGPLTYESMARLPALYRDAVAELRHNGFDNTSSAGSDSDLEQNEEIVSTGSGDTEGPEEDARSTHSGIEDLKPEAGVNWPYTFLEAPAPIRSDSDFDRHHAREFAKKVAADLVPRLLRLRSSVEVDQAIQQFAADICTENSANYSDSDYNLTAINADGIYLATCSALMLSLQLMKAGHYTDSDEPVAIPLTEQQFVTTVQNTGVLVYLSTFWLCELYQSIIATNPLSCLSQVSQPDSRCAIVDLLRDAGGFGSSQMLSDWQHLQSVCSLQPETNERRDAAKKLSRRLLTCCWESMVAILSAGLGDNVAANTTKSRLVTLSQKTLKMKMRRASNGGEALFALSLEGLHAAATLSNCLNLQHLAGKILSLLASNVCQTSGLRITASQALSMDVVLCGGLELGSYSSECWPPVFRVCRHVTQLEHELFSLQQQSAAAASTLSSQKSPNKNDYNGLGTDKANANACTMDEDDTCVDVYSFLQAPQQSAAHTNVATILKQYSDPSETPLLTQSDTAKVLSALSHQAETFFSEAAERLSLPALCQFIRNLCRASHDQLYRATSSKTGANLWWPRRAWKQPTKDSLPLALLLHRVGDVTLRVFRSARPLLHILKVWAITGPHLMDAACHRDRPISKRAIEYIQDIVTALLVEQTELPHFHFNEALLKPFENLLNTKNCDVDVKDQIVACLYEIVETHRTEIRSGWRPLFGAIHNALHHQVNIVNITDIFRVLLDSDNSLIFANAGLDCILCLLFYLQVSGKLTSPVDLDFLDQRLKFVERSTSILAFMLTMPNGTIYQTVTNESSLPYYHYAKSIDANIPNSMEHFIYFGNDYLQNVNEQHQISYRSLHIDWESIDELDKSCTVLKVWFLLLNHLTTSLIVDPVQHQEQILHCILKMFKGLAVAPGLNFGFYCVNQLLIPMIQNWMRYVNKAQASWLPIEKNFKHCCGLTTDLVVEFIIKSQETQKQGKKNQTVNNKMAAAHTPVDNLKFAQIQSRNVKWDTSSSDDSSKGDNHQAPVTPSIESTSKISTSATLALKQLLLVLIECTAQTQESVARVGVSCLKHVILSTGHLFNESQWMIACSAIHRACTVTIAPLRQLSFAFNEKSTSLNGDCATVKIESCRDSSPEESHRIQALAQQVFLMDVQRDQTNVRKSANDHPRVVSDDRSYFFQLHHSTDSLITIPYRSIVIGLLANKMLLQLVAKLLLNNLKCVPSELHVCIAENYTTEIDGELELGARSREILLRCVKQCLTSALEFDNRPGLKFLIQKVSGVEFAANLYKQMTSSWMIYFVSMVDSYLADSAMHNLGPDDLVYVLESCSRVSTTTAVKKKDKQREMFVRYLFALQDAWDLICEIYLSSGGSTGIVADAASRQDSVRSNNNPNNNNGSFENDEEAAASVPIFEEADNQPPVFPVPVRRNPFDNYHSQHNQHHHQRPSVEVAEIEQQRAASMLKDSGFKRNALTQLVVASMELLRSLPNDSAENLKVLMTPKIREAVRHVQVQFNDSLY